MHLHIPDFAAARVLIVGDVMLDRYWSGETGRISPEAPVPVVRIKHNEERAGGAANVALNVKMLGGAVRLLGMVGTDEAAQTLTKLLHQAEVDTCLESAPSQPTPVKLRVISLHQQLIRLDFEEGFHAVDKSAFMVQYRAHLPTADVVVLSDYNKGTLSQSAAMIALAKAAGKPVLVDPKINDFSAYHGATVITPNLKEFRLVVGSYHSETEFIDKARQVIAQYALEALLVTQGEQGMTLILKNGEVAHFPAQAREVYDVTGAGDTVIALMAAALAAGETLPVAAALANVAAGIVVGKLGAAGATLPELRRALQSAQAGNKGMLTESQLLVAVADARAHNETIVMTNGCFDILHAGHVAYLEQAKALGDRLIVAINDDASVRKLKGEERPINTLADRMAVVASLAAVDWVVPFSEDTPERLIGQVLPDILVKGGDYRAQEIAGAKAVLANGGQVKILDFVPGCSTTQTLARIQQREQT